MRPPPTYWLTRFVILRLLGVVYLVAFLSLARQVLPLIGSDGLTPAATYLERLATHFGSRAAAAAAVPSLFWFDVSDRWLVAGAWIGTVLSLLVVVGLADAILLLVLWALYLSYVHVGQLWYGYGWEIQLLETGFLAVFLCPLLDPRPFPKRPPPVAVLWLLRWLVFRIMLGAGLIKLRGDACWRRLTCLYWHYETQPLPNPLSRTLHFLPHWVARLGVAYNDLAELVAPWFVFGPHLARRAAGAVLLVFQLILIASGNLSFLNWLTIVPILACFDDGLLARVLPGALSRRVASAAAVARPSSAQRVVVGALVVVVALLSLRPVANLLSPRQAMNTSFDPLDLVNTYGAFGSVGRERDEIVFEGTRDRVLGGATRWRAYEFKCKPGDPARRPCIVSPWQWRLDWQIWFAAMTTPGGAPWTLHFVWKLLHNDPGTLSLLANDPFPAAPPRYVRALLYRYTFAPPGNPEGVWWRREPIGTWLPPLSADDPRLLDFLEAHGWRTAGAAVRAGTGSPEIAGRSRDLPHDACRRDRALRQDPAEPRALDGPRRGVRADALLRDARARAGTARARSIPVHPPGAVGVRSGEVRRRLSRRRAAAVASRHRADVSRAAGAHPHVPRLPGERPCLRLRRSRRTKGRATVARRQVAAGRRLSRPRGAAELLLPCHHGLRDPPAQRRPPGQDGLRGLAPGAGRLSEPGLRAPRPGARSAT